MTVSYEPKPNSVKLLLTKNDACDAEGVVVALEDGGVEGVGRK